MSTGEEGIIREHDLLLLKVLHEEHYLLHKALKLYSYNIFIYH